ncbi:YdeI/OmpD-associated family protein [Aurantibacter crassamenti]|uniref:DUF1801 domain-containing protein n=1 Tax=Aurantibacter crassamenti TaxID=1837375 RepID=UPI00193932BF|nr:DUF1801 domain-containing protein [Aurantibacter crassamenti]MBM1104660.1 YdeI/OmpD-associated family protein [Aurantibacter crassamenti]
MNSEVASYLDNLSAWQSELKLLQNYVSTSGLVEEFKWMHPCYTHNGKNVVLLHGFKNYCAILFTKGALLKDTENILVQQTENVQSARQIRFTTISEIEALEKTIKTYIQEAILVEESGLKIKKKKTAAIDVPEELKEIFSAQPEFEKAFKNLTPGRQRGYLLHFTQAKQSKTRIARIEKNMPRILNGKGLNDCICGQSKRMPNCDGSHKTLAK